MYPNNNIGYLLQHLAAVLSKQSDQALQEQLGVGLSQFKILMALQYHPQMQQRQIAEALGQTEASISRQIRLMVDKGLLESRVSPDSRREHITTTTSRGVTLTSAARETLSNYLDPMMKLLTADQQQNLLDILTIMHKHCCQDGKLAACVHPPTP
ncbi:MAG: hypothetical protein NVS1B7_7470 [Candidatus Saccharimonadales bacterium]